MSLLEINNLNVTYRSRGVDVRVVQEVSLEMKRGEAVAIVGESGSGKSSLALAIGRLLPQRNCQVTGDIRLDGKDVMTLSEKEIREFRRHQVGYVFQEPAVSLNPVLTVKDQISEVWGKSDDTRVAELLKTVELFDVERISNAYPHELSGGMKQRVMLAMALAKDPVLLIADEPTTALDVTIQKQILNLLTRLRKEKKLSLLLITHDLSVARAVSDRILIMKTGRITEETKSGKKFEVFNPYSEKLFKGALLDQAPKTRII